MGGAAPVFKWLVPGPPTLPLAAIGLWHYGLSAIFESFCMELVSTDNNPVPANARAGMLKTRDGAALRHAFWRTTMPPCKGTVILLQGRSEFIEKYFETITGLREAGFDVCTFDWRGQGGSSRLVGDPSKGYVDSFDQYVTDLEAVFSDVALPDCRPPFFILGHSMGSLVALLAAPRMANRVNRMVLCCPLIRFGDIPLRQRTLTFLAGLLTTLGLGSSRLGRAGSSNERRRFAGNRLTSDMRRYERNVGLAVSHPEIAVGAPTAAWIFAAGRAMDALGDPDFIGSITIPTILIGGGADKVVSLAAVEELGFKMRSGKTIVIPGARHEILQDRDLYREQLLAAFHAFVPGSRVL